MFVASQQVHFPREGLSEFAVDADIEPVTAGKYDFHVPVQLPMQRGEPWNVVLDRVAEEDDGVVGHARRTGKRGK